MAARLGITQNDVYEAVVRLWRKGEDRLTVAAVAKELGCAPPSVYHHLPNGLDDVEDIVHEQAHLDGWLWCDQKGTAWYAPQFDWPCRIIDGTVCPGPHWTVAKNEVITDAP